MPLDFPTSPTNGQIYDNYYWDSVNGVWNSLGNYAIPNLLSNATFTSSGSSVVPVTVRGAASQAANLQEWKNNAGNNLATISASGGLTLNNALTVGNGGTGATSLTLGAYLKGAGTSAITAQTGIPAGDIDSGTLAYARFPVGTVVQVQSTTISSAAGFSVGANALQDVGLNVTITPRSATNRILIIATLSSSAVSFARPSTVLLRNSTRIGIGDAAGARSRISASGAQGETAPGTQTVNFLDSPATTSAVTYRAQMLNLHSATQQYNFNYDVSNSDNGSHGRTASTITVMEIVA